MLSHHLYSRARYTRNAVCMLIDLIYPIKKKLHICRKSNNYDNNRAIMYYGYQEKMIVRVERSLNHSTETDTIRAIIYYGSTRCNTDVAKNKKSAKYLQEKKAIIAKVQQ